MPNKVSNRKIFISAVKRVARMILGHSFFTNLAAFCLPLYTLQIFDRIITTGSYESLWMLALGALTVSISGLAFEQLRRKSLVNFADYLNQQICPHISAQIHRGYEGKTLYRKVKLFQQQLITGSIASILDILWLPISVILIFLLSPVLGIFMLAANLGFGLIAYLKFKQEKSSLEEGLIHCSERTQRWLKSVNTIEHWEQSRPPANISATDKAGRLSDIHQGLRTFYQLGIPTIGAILLLQNSLTPGGFIAALIISARAIAPFDMLFANSAVVSLGRQVISEVSDYFDQISQRKIGSFDGSIKGLIELNNISIKNALNPQYENSLSITALSNISLRANPGEITALIGSVGAGQNEIIKILLGEQQPQSGNCLIDGTRRADWCPNSIQKHIAIAGESVRLTEGTILELISGFSAVNKTQAMEAAQLTGLNQRLIELNLCYDDWLDDRARNSAIGSQLERLITLTAAVASDAKIILLEYPETLCNSILLKQVEQTLLFLKEQQRTVILTTNSRQLIKQAQRSYLFENGTVVAPPQRFPSSQRVA
ncbi:MAG: ATP-binding cassette domain-containing protein [Porticoccaceae bacterium]|nr:ATP-binding cassette domain-containing protein [Porticoccaceae bacterium]